MLSSIPKQSVVMFYAMKKPFHPIKSTSLLTEKQQELYFSLVFWIATEYFLFYGGT